jgi:hypothetical protein
LEQLLACHSESFVGKRPRTSVKLSSHGQRAFAAHVAALQEIVARSGLTLTL